MISEYTRELAQKLSRARSTLELAILQDMNTTAKRMSLTSMTITRYGCTYCRKPERIKSPSLDALEEFYRQNVDVRGFAAHWTSKKGWD